jgi:hypothetical protein
MNANSPPDPAADPAAGYVPDPPAIGRRYIDGDQLVDLVERDDPAIAGTVAAWLRDEPRYPRLVGTTGAAKILEIHLPHVTRLRAAGEMPDPVPVEGGRDVYERDVVMAVARDRRRRRRERDRARAAKNAGSAGSAA